MFIYGEDDDKPETIAEIAARESTRQTVILIFGLLGTAGTVIVMRYLSGPDAIRVLKMNAALKFKRYAQRQVDFWQLLADKAATIYQRERP